MHMHNDLTEMQTGKKFDIIFQFSTLKMRYKSKLYTFGARLLDFWAYIAKFGK